MLKVSTSRTAVANRNRGHRPYHPHPRTPRWRQLVAASQPLANSRFQWRNSRLAYHHKGQPLRSKLLSTRHHRSRPHSSRWPRGSCSKQRSPSQLLHNSSRPRHHPRNRSQPQLRLSRRQLSPRTVRLLLPPLLPPMGHRRLMAPHPKRLSQPRLLFRTSKTTSHRPPSHRSHQRASSSLTPST